MRVNVDKVGPILIPKEVRVALGIGPDSQLELVQDGAGLRLDPVQPNQRTTSNEDGFPKLSYVSGVVITDEDLRRVLDDFRGDGQPPAS